MMCDMKGGFKRMASSSEFEQGVRSGACLRGKSRERANDQLQPLM